MSVESECFIRRVSRHCKCTTSTSHFDDALFSLLRTPLSTTTMAFRCIFGKVAPSPPPSIQARSDEKSQCLDFSTEPFIPGKRVRLDRLPTDCHESPRTNENQGMVSRESISNTVKSHLQERGINTLFKFSHHHYHQIL